MRTIQLINLHRFRGGADLVAEENHRMLTERGHESVLLTRDSRELARGTLGKARAFFAGMYSPSGRRMMVDALREHQPEVVHVHDVYPFFSPWALRDCKDAGVPVVMTCHDYRLTCPAACHLSRGEVCELCIGGREYWCVLRNCRGKVSESVAYALRSAISRKLRLFIDNVTVYIIPTEFVRARHVKAGFPDDRIVAAPHMSPAPERGTDAAANKYVAYVGRIRPEKGIATLVAAARKTGLEVRVAGDWAEMPGLVESAPANVKFLGPQNRDEVNELYRGARFLVFPSLWHETFGLVVAEAMGFGLPVIASDMGGVVELVDDGVTGLLHEAGDEDDLARKMTMLWNDPDLCRKMGKAGREKARVEYSEDAYYDRLMEIYELSIERAGRE